MNNELKILINEYYKIFYDDELSFEEFERLSIIHIEKILYLYKEQECIK